MPWNDTTSTGEMTRTRWTGWSPRSISDELWWNRAHARLAFLFGIGFGFTCCVICLRSWDREGGADRIFVRGDGGRTSGRTKIGSYVNAWIRSNWNRSRECGTWTVGTCRHVIYRCRRALENVAGACSRCASWRIVRGRRKSAGNEYGGGIRGWAEYERRNDTTKVTFRKVKNDDAVSSDEDEFFDDDLDNVGYF